MPETYIHQHRLPDDLLQLADRLKSLTDLQLSAHSKQKFTHHFFTHNSSQLMKDVTNQIRRHPIFEQLLCRDARCTITGVPSMDEVYVSNLSSAKTKKPLYGAYGNVHLHVDGAFPIPGAVFYRVLVPLTSGNDTVKTCFDEDGVCVLLNRGNMLAFDFDRTRHYVDVGNNDHGKPTYRMMLKLHFLVCKAGCTNDYASFLNDLHVVYEQVTRYMMATGTDPKTYYQYMFGVLSMYLTIITNNTPLLTMFCLVILAILVLCVWRPLWGAIGLGGLLVTWLFVAFVCYMRERQRHSLFCQIYGGNFGMVKYLCQTPRPPPP